ncbi:hypothetical protein A3D05_04600 [Candidatus Gottesmanbacteria bacterium RIFCSPHIGHO2_02_FULL_40_24]|uniref:Aminotransferase class I/classII large domain-containing protein n=1 Tax=Candidatus Gottesmanbacteria bacterium RIFCSPHIGHO2_01_FULL_40_15 TaxID=1798376 RepID=A0A1F5Z1X6_9BACT|nr:MAG: hypothetical protein A2777_05630 [Candidatus Gottesmanbacteria bacterium RIFCSPHIGHO2_01_FULL_40_15]OGG16150.1 MAG: hypothetical protein A3D05_04600 [Candidatus Gottesmanbacteria bacterium RIFCSPHIGHO2_02_FULL_40_24]OGG21464.1 MAG: hypothetical protein A3B48_04555 [Candidatus Gottesmanbacteria bacterium RIFCSPLOWO2_01_FULL_40_10]OGG25820.1 MAG: hypothetical protein A3E42_05870 [Candidatus Gottesmanbacteria bacterium RIFCSPHIGHO2_12_FULL_40_13]OGG33268.1 MAG: hypothetical protein A3I80_0
MTGKTTRQKMLKKTIEDYFVPWIKPLKMYVSDHIELAWQKPGLHRMMSNENPVPPSRKIIKTILKYSALANRYPDQGLSVRSKIAAINGLKGPENVVLGNGSSEIFDMIFRSFVTRGDQVIQEIPCFGIYKLRCELLGGKIVSVPMIYRDNQLLYNTDALLKLVSSKTKIITIANPNNPSGNFMDNRDFVKIAGTGIPFVIDEAYIEYSGLGKSQVNLIKKFQNVIITRTLSKAYGLAGLRFGYLLADEGIAGKIAATLIPWNVGTISMWTALTALEDNRDLEKKVKYNNRQVAFIIKMLENIPGLISFPSRANFILFDAGPAGYKGADIIEFATKRGIILRGEKTQYGSDGWFRVTIGTEKENQKFVGLIRDFFSFNNSKKNRLKQ